MNRLLYRIRQKMAPSKHHLDVSLIATNSRLDSISKVTNSTVDRIDMCSLTLVKIMNPELDDLGARKLLFENLPAATGDMALYQSANSKLLHELDKICRQNGLQYWMWAGSAIAVEARGSAIPWDDDIDVCIMRSDLKRLISVTKNNSDYCVTICYDYRAKNIQYRFVSRNKDILNFIDLVACDYATEATATNDKQYKKLKGAIIHEFESSGALEGWRNDNFIYNQNDNVTFPQRARKLSKDDYSAEIESINDIYSKYHALAVNQNILTDNRPDAKAIAYGLDGLFNFPNRQDIWDKSIIFPLEDKSYDGFDVMTAHNNESFCSICYNNWPYIPRSIKYGEHALNQLELHQEYRQALVEFVGQK